jgi:prepilin-type N-terminal cleavage/methylation domain-containing protein/prepilin-type processing-associated H-X9-DG protein
MRSNSRAFTLIELLTCIAIIAVLLALAIPALRGARGTSQSTKCLATLRTLGQGSALRANSDGRGLWCNVFEQRKDLLIAPGVVNFPAGSTSFSITYLMQVRYWQAPFMDVVWEEGGDPGVWACPKVATEYNSNSAVQAAMSSFYYSASLFTDPRLWDPADPVIRSTPERYCRGIGVHEVVHPSQKVAFAEVMDFHGGGMACYSSGVPKLNAVFADGHCQRVRMERSEPPLDYVFDYGLVGWPSGVAIPFSSSAWGARGVDVR